MSYAEYSNQLKDYESAMSLRKSLQMTIRMNTVWLRSKNSIRGRKRVKVISEAQSQLATLIVPPKPVQPTGYEVIVDGAFEGFYPTDDIELVREQVTEALGHNNFTLNQKPRFKD